ncbi:hypothetical protein [Fodinicola feengrottensis]|uniref:hypothetical protein n=1 Tax=Fodinicola feengrottensis TaxID=435914 RepID=UPI0036F2A8C9
MLEVPFWYATWPTSQPRVPPKTVTSRPARIPQPTPAIRVTPPPIASWTSVETMPAVFIRSPQPPRRAASGTAVSA